MYKEVISQNVYALLTLGGVEQHASIGEKKDSDSINMLPSENKVFMGRKQDLEKLSDDIKKNPGKAIILHGPGGIGKTSLAYQYAYQHYSKIIRIRAETPATALVDYRNLGERLNLNTKNRSLEDLAKEVNAALTRSNGSGVIIFDNVNSYQDPFNDNDGNTYSKGLQEFFPSSTEKCNFQVIVTTRNRSDWEEDISKRYVLIELTGLREDESTELFKKLSGIEANLDGDSRDKLSSFLSELAHFPLAVCQSALYLKHKAGIRKKKPSEYLNVYLDNFHKTLEGLSSPENNRLIPKDLIPENNTPRIRMAIYTTFDMNIDEFSKKSENGLSMLRYAALMNPDATEKEQFYDLCFKEIKTTDVDKNEFEKKTDETSLAVIKKYRDKDFIVMHRIIQSVVASKIAKEDIKNFIYGLLNHLCADNFDPWFVLEHFTFIMKRIDNREGVYAYVEPNDKKVVEGFHQLGIKFKGEGDYIRSVSFLAKAIRNLSPGENLYEQVKKMICEILDKNIKLEGINEGWIDSLCSCLDVNMSREVLSVLFKKQTEMEKNTDYNLGHQGVRIMGAIRAIVKAIEKIDVKDKNANDYKHLSIAYYVLGRHDRENLKKGRMNPRKDSQCTFYLNCAYESWDKASSVSGENKQDFNRNGRYFLILLQMIRLINKSVSREKALSQLDMKEEKYRKIVDDFTILYESAGDIPEMIFGNWKEDFKKDYFWCKRQQARLSKNSQPNFDSHDHSKVLNSSSVSSSALILRNSSTTKKRSNDVSDLPQGCQQVNTESFQTNSNNNVVKKARKN